MRNQKRKEYRHNLFTGKRTSSDRSRINGGSHRDGGSLAKMFGMSKDKDVVKRMGELVGRATRVTEESTQ